MIAVRIMLYAPGVFGLVAAALLGVRDGDGADFLTHDRLSTSDLVIGAVLFVAWPLVLLLQAAKGNLRRHAVPDAHGSRIIARRVPETSK